MFSVTVCKVQRKGAILIRVDLPSFCLHKIICSHRRQLFTVRSDTRLTIDQDLHAVHALDLVKAFYQTGSCEDFPCLFQPAIFRRHIQNHLAVFQPVFLNGDILRQKPQFVFAIFLILQVFHYCGYLLCSLGFVRIKSVWDQFRSFLIDIIL